MEKTSPKIEQNTNNINENIVENTQIKTEQITPNKKSKKNLITAIISTVIIIVIFFIVYFLSKNKQREEQLEVNVLDKPNTQIEINPALEASNIINQNQKLENPILLNTYTIGDKCDKIIEDGISDEKKYSPTLIELPTKNIYIGSCSICSEDEAKFFLDLDKNNQLKIYKKNKNGTITTFFDKESFQPRIKEVLVERDFVACDRFGRSGDNNGMALILTTEGDLYSLFIGGESCDSPDKLRLSIKKINGDEKIKGLTNIKAGNVAFSYDSNILTSSGYLKSISCDYSDQDIKKWKCQIGNRYDGHIDSISEGWDGALFYIYKNETISLATQKNCGKKIISSDKKVTKIKTIIHNYNKYELSSIQNIFSFLITENNDLLFLTKEEVDKKISYNLYLYPINVDSLNEFKLILADKLEIDLTKTSGNLESKPTIYSISEIVAKHK